MIPWLKTGDSFHRSSARSGPNGLLAAGDDLSLPRLLPRPTKRHLPVYGEGQPVLWSSPDPRMVLFPSELKIPRSLRKRLALRDYEVRADSAFEDVIAPAPNRAPDRTDLDHRT